MQRVSRDRDDRRWADRGEQLMRLDFSRERRMWEAEKARSAPPEAFDWSELDAADDAYALSGQSAGTAELPSASQAGVNAMEVNPEEEQLEAEMVRLEEEREMEELLALMEEEEHTRASSTYGSDDDDYDGLFMELVNQNQGEHYASPVAQEDEMDMSA